MTWVRMDVLLDVKFVKIISGMSLDIVCFLVRLMFMWYIHMISYTISELQKKCTTREMDAVAHSRV